MNKENGLSRRGFIRNAGLVTASAGIALAAGDFGFVRKAGATGGTTEKWPWPYVKLDPEKTAQIAYDEWYRVFCGAAVINSVFSQLREEVGEPYTSFPSDAFVFLEGGMVGWGTVCGSNAGANVVANVITGPRTLGAEHDAGHLIGSDIMDWYANTALPVFKPAKPRVETAIMQTTAQSPLCHVSVGRWMKETGYPIKSAERKDRCARVAASVAQQLVTHLNAWKDGDYDPHSSWSGVGSVGITAQQNCTDCHGDSIPEAPTKKI